MHRIDHETATSDHKFTEGNPTIPVPATVVTDDWLNAVQEELVAAITGAGLELEKSDNTQLWQAISQTITTAVDNARPGLATTKKPGLVQIGDGLAITPEGLLSVLIASTSQAGLVKPRYGLKIGKDGSLDVDFGDMPTDKFEALLKSIRVPIWLTKNKNFYVNGTTGSDTLGDGRGESEGKPFKTIQACVSYVCENYNIGPYNLIINVAAGVYAENLVIPEIARTTGTLFIWGHSQTDTIIETGNQATRQAVTVKVEAFSRVDIRRFTIKAIDSKLNPGLENIYLDAFSSAKYAKVDIRECVLEGYQTTASENLDLNRMRVISNEGGVALTAPIAIKGIYTAVSKGNKISGIVVYTGGTIAIQGDTSANTFEMSGDFLYTVNVSGGFIERNVNSKPVVSGEATGKRYYCTSGGGISTLGGGPDYFPGSIAGTVQTETYSWYS